MKNYSALLIILSIFILSCNRGDDDLAGKGGNATLKVVPRHHGNKIDSCTVYIKYNAIDEPSDKKYDDSAKCIQEGGLPVATFPGLKRGSYYVYGYGWDPNLSPPKAVEGAFAYPIQEEKVQTLELAVSED